MLLTNFNSSAEFAIWSEIPSGEGLHQMETIQTICNINPWTDFLWSEIFLKVILK